MEIDQSNADHQTKDTPAVGAMVEESNKARVVVADGSNCWGGVIFSPTLHAFVRFEDKKS
jgi:hypothetical protein